MGESGVKVSCEEVAGAVAEVGVPCPPSYCKELRVGPGCRREALKISEDDSSMVLATAMLDLYWISRVLRRRKGSWEDGGRSGVFLNLSESPHIRATRQ